MIASPSDVQDARDAVEGAIHGWNDANARTKQVILQPWRWETASVPTLGGHPQTLINAQGVDDSDVVFALFGSKLGSPTPDAVSGTVEEIERAEEQGKPVHLYFSTAPLPSDVNTAQLDGLRAFKQEIQARGLYGEFSNSSQLTHEVWKAIEFDISNLNLDLPVMAQVARGVDFRVQPMRERESTGVDKRGKQQYRTRTWLEITNAGTVDAQDVRYEVPQQDSGLHLAMGDTATVIHAGQTRTLNVSRVMGGSGDPVLRINWTEDGEPQSKDFHVG
jgi:hypothetical protein